MRRTLRLAFLAALLLSPACAAAVGTAGGVSVPEDARAQCDGHCRSIGMSLGAVAIMANNVGCVCEVSGRGTAVSSGASATAGMAAIALQQAAAAQQQQHKRR
jgi:hypothetical protein